MPLSFGHFEFQTDKPVGQRGGGVRELHSLLKHARRKQVRDSVLMQSERGVAHRGEGMLHTALLRVQGHKVKDDASRIAKTLAKRRTKKRKSAKEWAKRRDALQHSVDNILESRHGNKVEKGKLRDAKKGKKNGGKHTEPSSYSNSKQAKGNKGGSNKDRRSEKKSKGGKGDKFRKSAKKGKASSGSSKKGKRK